MQIAEADAMNELALRSWKSLHCLDYQGRDSLGVDTNFIPRLPTARRIHASELRAFGGGIDCRHSLRQFDDGFSVHTEALEKGPDERPVACWWAGRRHALDTVTSGHSITECTWCEYARSRSEIERSAASCVCNRRDSTVCSPNWRLLLGATARDNSVASLDSS